MAQTTLTEQQLNELERGYRVYSVGADGEDQHGRTRTLRKQPYDVVFEVPR